MLFIKRFAVTIISLGVIGIALYFFLDNLIFKSLPSKFEERNVSIINDTIKVFRNHYGFPHIIAKNEKDAFFMIGYCHAQDRLWQMDIMRSTGRGELSEIFGQKTLNVDKFFRSVGLNFIAADIYKNLSKTSKVILDAYCNGINSYIENHPNNLSFEFGALDYKPKIWIPADCIIIERLLALEMSSSFWTDLCLGEIAEKIGPQKTLNLIPTNFDNEIHVYDTLTYSSQMSKTNLKQKSKISYNGKKMFQNRNFGTRENNKNRNFGTKENNKNRSFGTRENNKNRSFGTRENNKNRSFGTRENNKNKSFGTRENNKKRSFGTNRNINEITSAFKYIRNFLEINSNSSGSNAWVIKKSKTGNYGAILANDPHFNIGIPAKWYQLHVTCPSFNVVGMTIPGLPLFWVGRNDKIAWGFANMMVDDCDFYIEKVDLKDDNYYYTSDGKKIKFKFIKDSIKIKNALDYNFYLRKATRSLTFTDYLLYNNQYNIVSSTEDTTNPVKLIKKYCITMNWTGKEKSDEILSLYNISKAKNWSQFTSSINTYNTPALIFVYADNSGNIGLTPAGSIPIRQKACIPQLPNPAWLENYDWQGITKANTLFQPILNPPKKYMIAANNKISISKDNFITSYWEPDSRAERIDELLKDYNDYSSREAQIMQMDILSTYSRLFMSLVMPHLDNNINQFDETEKAAINRLKKWDNFMATNFSAPSIFNAFLDRVIYNTFYDELGDNLYYDYTFNSALPTRRIIELLKDSISSPWFDDVRTKQYEYRNWIIVKSFKEAVSMLKDKFDEDDINKWNWGKIHTLTLNHVLTFDKLLKTVVTLGKFDMPGCYTTINYAPWSFKKPFEVTAAASMRFISDMSEENVYTSIPGGTSGDPISDNYANQIQLWLNGGYITVSSSPVPQEDFILSIILNPNK